MTKSVRVFVNGVALDAPSGATALDAVRGWSSEVAEAVARGERVITDSRGLPAPPDALVQAGAIFRIIPVSSRRGARDRPAEQLTAHDGLAAQTGLAAENRHEAASDDGSEAP
jgi:hypothetical protein